MSGGFSTLFLFKVEKVSRLFQLFLNPRYNTNYFTGMFIAKISKGRTIKQFINGTLTAPVLYSILWMVIFGGIGIRHEREASNMGLCCNNDANGNWFLSANDSTSI